MFEKRFDTDARWHKLSAHKPPYMRDLYQLNKMHLWCEKKHSAEHEDADYLRVFSYRTLIAEVIIDYNLRQVVVQPTEYWDRELYVVSRTTTKQYNRLLGVLRDYAHDVIICDCHYDIDYAPCDPTKHGPYMYE